MRFEAVEYEYEAETKPDAEDLHSRSYRGLEVVVFGLPVVMSAVQVALFTVVSRVGFGDLGLGATVAAIIPLLLCLVAAPALAYMDANRVRRHVQRWRPNPIVYALGIALSVLLVFLPGLLLGAESVRHLVQFPFPQLFPRTLVTRILTVTPPLVGLYYLYNRHEFVRDAVDGSRWWYGLPAGVVLGLGTVALLHLAPSIGDIAFPVASVTISLFPVAAYLDARYVSGLDADWQPNPIGQYTLALASIMVFPGTAMYSLYAGYYLFRRYRTVGLRSGGTDHESSQSSTSSFG